MSTSQVANVLAAITSVLAADASILAAGVPVYDGPAITNDSDLERIVVGVGADGDNPLAATSQQEWRSDGGASAFRDEIITLPVTVVARSGDTDMPTRRARAVLLAGYVEAALRTNYTLGLSQVAWVEVAEHRLSQAATDRGSVVYDELTIRVRAVI